MKAGERAPWLLRAPGPVTVVAGGSRALVRLGGLRICRLSREQLLELLEEDLERVDEEALGSLGVLAASLFASVPPRSFTPSSEASESLSRLLSDSERMRS